MGASNRRAYILAASADFAVCDGRWRAFGREAFLTREEAEAEVEPFLERCRAAKDEALGPDPDTLTVKVMALAFEDDLDAGDGHVYLLTAEGRDAMLEQRTPYVCGTLFGSRAQAEAETDAFLDRCADPEYGFRNAIRETLVAKIGALPLRQEPVDRPAP